MSEGYQVVIVAGILTLVIYPLGLVYSVVYALMAFMLIFRASTLMTAPMPDFEFLIGVALFIMGIAWVQKVTRFNK